MTRHRKGLEKVINIPTMRDEDNQKYIPYCSFHVHMGIPYRPLDCIRKHCHHYQRFYYDKEK
jgi:hypothetical protein